MSQEKVYRTFARFGLTRTDAKVYSYLAKKGPRKGKDLCNSLNMQKQQLYPCLKNLQRKTIVTASYKRPTLFSALPFDRVLDLLIKTNLEEAKHLTQNRQDLLSAWQVVKLNKSNNNP